MKESILRTLRGTFGAGLISLVAIVANDVSLTSQGTDLNSASVMPFVYGFLAGAVTGGALYYADYRSERKK